MRRIFLGILATVGFTAAVPALAQQVGEVGVDWLGNDIIVEAIKDPGVDGVTCHVSYFERGVVDRLQKGNWFEDPSDSAISCRQTGPITIHEIDLGEAGEEVFKQGISLIWKKQVVNRIYDKANDTLIYLAHSRCRTGRPKCRCRPCRSMARKWCGPRASRTSPPLACPGGPGGVKRGP